MQNQSRYPDDRLLSILILLAAQGAWGNCDNPISDGVYIAVSSEERGCRSESDLFQALVQETTTLRAKEICKVAGCQEPLLVETEEDTSFDGDLEAKIPRNVNPPALILSRFSEADLESRIVEMAFPNLQEKSPFERRIFSRKKPWVFGNDGSKKVGTRMWYFGHTITFTSPISILSGPFIPIVTPTWIVTGGVITTASRVVERNPRAISPEHALYRLSNKKKINKIYDWFGETVPHLVFKKVTCKPSFR